MSNYYFGDMLLSLQFNSCISAFRLTTVFFSLFANESFVDVGYGNGDITDHAIERMNTYAKPIN